MLETNSMVRLMKKLLGIVVLSFLLSGNTYANCMSDIEINVKRFAINSEFEVLNNNDRLIEITDVRILTSSNQTIKSFKPVKSDLKPFGRIVYYFFTDDINIKVWKKTALSCRYK